MSTIVEEIPSPIRLGAIDNHPIVLRGIGAVLAETESDIELVGVAESVDQFLACVVNADVVLLDLGMPDGDPVERNVARLVEHGVKVLLFTAEERPIPIQRAIKAGASGLLLKIDPVSTIARAVRDVDADRLACSGPLAHALLTDMDIAGKLSPRQVEILRSISEGMPYKTIARLLGISEATVREHLNRAVANYRGRGIDPGNSHGLVSRAREEGHLDG